MKPLLAITLGLSSLTCLASEHVCIERVFKNTVHSGVDGNLRGSKYLINIGNREIEVKEIVAGNEKPYVQSYLIIGSNGEDVIGVFYPRNKKILPILESFSINVKDQVATKVTTNAYGAGVSLLTCKME